MQTITRIAIHAEGENPVFGEGVIRVCLSDESGGMFITIDNPDATSPLKVDADQFKEITNAVEFLLSQDSAQDATKGERLERENAALQSKIDELMQEYCPEEMTDDQWANYAAHQTYVTPNDQAQGCEPAGEVSLGATGSAAQTTE